MADPPTARARIADVAREAGVSKAAVSFAFNSPQRLRPETADRIKQVATALGYRPHPVARMLTAGSTATIGIVSAQPLAEAFGNPAFSSFAEGVARVLEGGDFGLQFIAPVHGSLDQAVARATVDGVIVIGPDAGFPYAGLPSVSVGSLAIPGRSASQLGEEAARRLLSLLDRS